jgi:hypothetical protein
MLFNKINGILEEIVEDKNLDEVQQTKQRQRKVVVDNLVTTIYNKLSERHNEYKADNSKVPLLSVMEIKEINANLNMLLQMQKLLLYEKTEKHYILQKVGEAISPYIDSAKNLVGIEIGLKQNDLIKQQQEVDTSNASESELIKEIVQLKDG